jgi:putative alpha-1,2-mannosidase
MFSSNNFDSDVFIKGDLSVTGNITLSGNIIINGTIDGRNISQDGATLDQLTTDVVNLNALSDINTFNIEQLSTAIQSLSIDTVSQEEAELGISTERRIWTSERVRQSTRAWWDNGIPLQSKIIDQGMF